MPQGELSQVNKSSLDQYQQKFRESEKCLYNHWLECVQNEEPSVLIKRFRLLFVEGSGYRDQEIAQAFEEMLLHKQISQEFASILCRCCHILINRWYGDGKKQGAIQELIELLGAGGANQRPLSMYSRTTRRLFDLMQEFIKSEQYLTLKRVNNIIQKGSNNGKTGETKALGELFPRYPYLYRHCLLSDGSSQDYQKTVKKLQSQKQKQFEIDLSQYVAHQIRKAKARKETTLSFGRPEPVIIKNPTLLSDQELFSALKQFVGKVEGKASIRDLAQRFVSQSSSFPNYRAFKNELFDYLKTSLTESSYGKRVFSEKLYKQIQGTFPHSDSQKFTEFLMIRTCSQLLNFLVVESPQNPEHFIFLDLISNLGPMITIGLLIKIVLICNQVKPYLEKRFSILLFHYEDTAPKDIVWLVKALENLNIALSCHFGSMDLTFVR